MSVSTQTSSANYSPKPCSKCGAKELQRKPRRLFHKAFALYPYVCLNCAHRESKFRLTIGTILKVFFFLALIGGITYFAMNPISFHKGDDGSQGTADALARARSSAGGLSTFEQMVIKKPRTTMDNATVLKLWKANVGANVILQLIRTTTPDYDVSANSIIELKEAGVDQAVILAMIDASYTAR
jgi:hypothetical protein